VRVEREHRGDQTFVTRPRHGALEDGAMASMHAVEVADGDERASPGSIEPRRAGDERGH